MQNCIALSCSETAGAARSAAQCCIWKFTTDSSGATQVRTPKKTSSRYATTAIRQSTANDDYMRATNIRLFGVHDLNAFEGKTIGTEFLTLLTLSVAIS